MNNKIVNIYKLITPTITPVTKITIKDKYAILIKPSEASAIDMLKSSKTKSLLLISPDNFTNPTIMAVINLTMYGIFLAYYALNDGSIWGACAWHALWNWTEGHLFGIIENGEGSRNGLLCNIELNGNKWLTGGDFGTNSSLILTFVLFIGISFQLLKFKKSKKISKINSSQ